MNKLNRLYAAWAAEPSQKLLGELLQVIHDRVSERYARLVDNDDGSRGPLDSNFEDIASDTMIEVWRALPGYPGKDPLKGYEDCGKFASYVATVARGTRTKRSDLHDNSKVSHHDANDLQYVQIGLDPGFESEEPEDYYVDPED